MLVLCSALRGEEGCREGRGEPEGEGSRRCEAEAHCGGNGDRDVKDDFDVRTVSGCCDFCAEVDA